MRIETNLVKYIMTSDFLDDIEDLIQLRRDLNDESYSYPKYHIYEAKVDTSLGNIEDMRPSKDNSMYHPLQPGLLEKFLDAYLDGMLRKSLFSEREDATTSKLSSSSSDSNEGGASTIHGEVASLVGLNFIEHVISLPDIDTLAFFYAPWCTFCKSAEPVFYEIA